LTAPNSKVLAFQVDRICERYSFHITDAEGLETAAKPWDSPVLEVEWSDPTLKAADRSKDMKMPDSSLSRSFDT
jgi:hypothetical protein